MITPPQRRRDHVPDSKSSSSLPSPSELMVGFGGDRRLNAGSRAAAVPHDVALGFQSTSKLLQYNLLSLQQEAQEKSEPEKKARKPNAREKDEGLAGKEAAAKDAARDPVVVVKKTATKKTKPTEESGQKTKKPRKRKSDEMEEPVARKQRSTKARKTTIATDQKDGKEAIKSAASKDNAVPKPRGRRKAVTHEAEPEGVPLEEKAKPRKKTTKSSNHFSAAADDTVAAGNPDDAARGVELDLAVNRKTNWTPPKPGPHVEEIRKEVDIYTVPSSSPAFESPGAAPAVSKFADLQKNFAYDGRKPKSASPTRAPRPGHGFRSAQRIELIPQMPQRPAALTTERPAEGAVSPTKGIHQQAAVPELPPKAPMEKAKKVSPKKGPGGITGRSIARYAHVEVEAAAQAEKAKVSPHFAPIFVQPPLPTIDQEASVPVESKKTTKPRKPRAKKADTAKESKKEAAKVKIVPPPAPKLASPGQHDAKLKRQDLLFGTSSQLNQDMSPNLVRGLQQSLSEQAIEGEEIAPDSTAPIAGRYGDSYRRTRQKLWGESRHGNPDDSFLDISDVDVSSAHRPVNVSFVGDSDAAPGHGTNAFAPAANDLPENGAGEESAPIPSNGFWLSKGRSDGLAPLTDPPDLLSTAITITSSSPRPVSPTRVALRQLSTNTRSPSKSPMKQDTFDKSECRANVAMIDNRASHDTSATTQSRESPTRSLIAEQALSPAKKPRGRPRKVAASSPGPQPPRRRGRPKKRVQVATMTSPTRACQAEEASSPFLDIDEIEDSEPDHTPSPRRKTSSPSASQVLPLTTTEETELETTRKRINTPILNASHPRWPAVKAKLFPEILAAVKAAPPTGSIKHPSWYEKMLLYDPIVLEDLTSWLNDQGLRLEGKDAALVEVSPWMAQLWCENNSICCLWKEGLRGGVRVRY